MNQAHVGRRPEPGSPGARAGPGTGTGPGWPGPAAGAARQVSAGHDRCRDGCGGRCLCDSRASGNRYGPAI